MNIQAYLALHPMGTLVLAMLALAAAVLILDNGDGPPPAGTTSSGFRWPRWHVMESAC